LLVGTAEQLGEGEQLLRTAGTRSTEDFAEIAMETVEAPEQGPGIGKRLSELNLPQRFGIQVCAVERGGKRDLRPESTFEIRAGDKLLALGPHEGILAFRNFLWTESV
jgi:Trk K+ transport system NAD-binding subunit